MRSTELAGPANLDLLVVVVAWSVRVPLVVAMDA